MQALGVKSLGCVRLDGTSASALEAVAKSWKLPNASNGLALLLVFHEIFIFGFSICYIAMEHIQEYLL